MKRTWLTAAKYFILQSLVLTCVGCTRADSRPVEKLPPEQLQLLHVPTRPDALPAVTDPRVSGSFSHDSNSFTQGLLFHNGHLYESTGHYGQSKVRILDPSNGEVLSEKAVSSDYFAEGLAVLDKSVYQLTWREGVCLVYNEDLELQKQLFYSTDGWGLSVEPEEKLLILSDGSAQLRFCDPKSLITRYQRTVTDGNGAEVAMLNELEWVKGEIWANIWTSDSICRIDPKTGKIKGWVHLEELVKENQQSQDDVLNGIAYDPESDRLWLTGKWWSKIYRIDDVSKIFFTESK